MLYGFVIKRNLSFKTFIRAFRNGAITAATMLVMSGVAGGFGRIITMYQLPQTIGRAIANFTTNPHTKAAKDLTFALLKTGHLYHAVYGEAYQNSWLLGHYTRELGLKDVLIQSAVLGDAFNGPFWMLRPVTYRSVYYDRYGNNRIGRVGNDNYGRISYAYVPQ